MKVFRLSALGVGILFVAAGCIPVEDHLRVKKELKDTQMELAQVRKDTDKEIKHLIKMDWLKDQAYKEKLFELTRTTATPNNINYKIKDGGAVLGDATFTRGSFTLSKSAQKFIDGLVPQLKNGKVAYIEVVGHTDKTKIVKLKKRGIHTNGQLGYRRAEAVMKYLLTKGISANKIKCSSWGPAKNIRKIEIKAFQA